MKTMLLGMAAAATIAVPAFAWGENSRHESIVQLTGKHGPLTVGGCTAGTELFAAELRGRDKGEPVTSAVRLCTQAGLSAHEKASELERFRAKLAGNSGIKGIHRAEILRRIDLRLAELRVAR